MNDPLPRLKTISSLFSNILSTILLNKKSWYIKIKNGNSGLHFSTKGLALIEKSPNTDFFLVRIFLYSVQIQENTNQKKLHI